METVLVIGATGNIGVSAVIGALRSKRNVLAVVRSEASGAKLIHNIGSATGITLVVADLTSDTGLQGVVSQVKAGKLPAFQHVYSAAGGYYEDTKLLDLSLEELRKGMRQNFESNILAYQATMPYLLEQKHPASTWTLITGAAGDMGARPAPGVTQGALYAMAAAASLDNTQTNVRFNEVYLAYRVEVDADAVQHGVMKASDFAQVYEGLLAHPEIRSSRVRVLGAADLQNLKHESLIWKH